MVKPKGSPKTGGRKKGTPNVMTRELKEICRQSGSADLGQGADPARRDDDVSRAVRFLLYDRIGLGRESLRSKRGQAQSVSVRTRSRKRRVTLPRIPSR
jgi:hypothetical protein